ncbi:MAG: tagaturonate reductase [Prevotellaceae bacterium]|jgi:tagaturonate reductase|nr:tagaturonate reductase [Prevotellaceae bacterium]
MNQLNRKTAPAAKLRPERIIQFGEGNFLRAFVDWIVFNMNEKAAFDSSVVVVQPIESGMVDALNAQDGLYHLNLQGIDAGKQVDSIQLIDVISRGLNPYAQFGEYLKLAENPDMRFVISNTTEAGIAFRAEDRLDDKPAKSYPGKLTQLLYHRFKTFKGAADKGLLIMPCELIFHNGAELKKCIELYIEQWQLGAEFKAWFEASCGVYSTLVDRIVPGYPKDNIGEILARVGYEDKLVVKGEIFHLWVIEAPASVAREFPADKAGLNVLFVPSEKPYHERKVTLLNGPHTVLSPVAYLSGLDTVREACEHEVIGAFVRRVMFDELLPTLNLPKAELEKFANDVLDRFRNPFVKHFVTSIMLNSFPKFKTRDLPGLKIYLARRGTLPKGLVLGLAAICVYYRGGKRGNDTITPNDDPQILDLLTSLWASSDAGKVAQGVLAARFIWGEDLNEVKGLPELLTASIDAILRKGAMEAAKL